MAIKRSYDDACAAAHALDLVGERWALLIVRELLLGPKRFTDLRGGLGAISPNVLTQRLGELESFGIIVRRKLPRPASAWVYELTQWGQELEPIVLQLARWGVRSPVFLRGAALGPDALMLSLKAMFKPEAADTQAFSINIKPGQDADDYHICLETGVFTITRAAAPSAQASLTAATDTLLALAFGNLSLDAAVSGHGAAYSGDKAALQQFFSLFSLPTRAAQADDLEDTTMPPTISTKAKA